MRLALPSLTLHALAVIPPWSVSSARGARGSDYSPVGRDVALEVREQGWHPVIRRAITRADGVKGGNVPLEPVAVAPRGG